MVRINLLPPEIGEKRKQERRIGLALAAGAIVYVALFLVYGILAWIVMQRNDELQSNKDLAANLQNQAEAFRIFEDKEQDLARRVSVAEVALARRAEWGRIANELSLVMPSDVWVTRISGNQEQGLTITARAVDAQTDMPDAGHKAVAKTLVRLAELDLLTNVWLISSTKGSMSLGAAGEHPIIDFELKSDVVRPPAPEGINAGVPAPPTQPGQ